MQQIANKNSITKENFFNLSFTISNPSFVSILLLISTDSSKYYDAYMDSSESCNNGRRSESVRNEREMRQVTLNARIKDLLRTSVAQRRSILVQKVHQFLGDNSGKRKRNVIRDMK